MGNSISTRQRTVEPTEQKTTANYHRVYPSKRSISEQRNNEFFYSSCPLLEVDSPLRKRFKLSDQTYLSLPNDLPSSFRAANRFSRLSPINEYSKDENKDTCDNVFVSPIKRRTSLHTNRSSTYSSPADCGQWTEGDLMTTRMASAPHSPMSKSVTFDKNSAGGKRKSSKIRAITHLIDNIFATKANRRYPGSPNDDKMSSLYLKNMPLNQSEAGEEFPIAFKRTYEMQRNPTSSPEGRPNVAVMYPSDGDSFRTGSSNSLTDDGKTTWPTPMLEVVFLPEFPHKSLVNENSFMILGTIAKGTFGKVYRVSLTFNNKTVFAMKVQQKSTIIAKDAVQQVKDEVSIHQVLGNFSFVAQIYCVWQNRLHLYIVLQYIPGYGDMHQLWKDLPPMNEKVVKIWAAELATALDFIHGSGIIYRDLKMENILLDDNGHVQLIDFGLAKWLNYGERTNTICGTLQYMAPEILQGDDYGHGADWWSLGVLIHALLTGFYPFDVSDSHTSMNITAYEPDQSLTQPAISLLSKLLRRDPRWRLRSFTLIKHENFFSDISFDDINRKKVISDTLYKLLAKSNIEYSYFSFIRLI